MTLLELVEHVPNHARLSIVVNTEAGKKVTMYSGYKGDFIKFCNFRCIFPAGYTVTCCYAGSWEMKNGLIIVVKLADDYEKTKRTY